MAAFFNTINATVSLFPYHFRAELYVDHHTLNHWISPIHGQHNSGRYVGQEA